MPDSDSRPACSLKNNLASLSQWPPEGGSHLWPNDVTTFAHLTVSSSFVSRKESGLQLLALLLILHKALWCINPLHIAISALLLHCCFLAQPTFAQFIAVCCWHTICSYTAACPIRPSTLSAETCTSHGQYLGLAHPAHHSHGYTAA